MTHRSSDQSWIADTRPRALSEKLKAEAEGILAWAVEGALLWQKEGLESPEEVRIATEGYRNEQDSLGRFLAEECMKADLVKVLAKTFKERYAEWCRENGETGVPTREVGQCLEKLGFRRIKRNGAWYFLGLSLSSSDVGTLSDVDSESPYRENSMPNDSETTSLNVTRSLKTGILNLEEG